MPNAIKKTVIALWMVTIAALLLLILVSLDTPQERDMLQWANAECEQGNKDACRLERNLLTKR